MLFISDIIIIDSLFFYFGSHPIQVGPKINSNRTRGERHRERTRRRFDIAEGGVLRCKKSPKCEGTTNFFTNSKLRDILAPDPAPIPLVHPAHVREGGCFGDEGSRDSRLRGALSAKYGIRIIGTKPPRFPNATRMKSIYRRGRCMPRAFFLSTGGGRGKKRRTGSLGRRWKAAVLNGCENTRISVLWVFVTE